MVILLNRNACGKTADLKWKKIENEILNRIGDFTLIDSAENVEASLFAQLQKGECKYISAGGDGTLNFLINFISKRVDPNIFRKIQIGAIGLGSSNDFHKPFSSEKSIAGIPTRINFSKTFYHDLGKIEWQDMDAQQNVNLWINNASIGITAEANYLFNNPDMLLERLKKINTNQAIIYSTLNTILHFHNITLIANENNFKATTITTSNLGIVKNPHFSGSLCYDSPYLRDNGKFYVHLLHDLKKFQLLRMLYCLSKRKFMGLDGTSSLLTSDYLVDSAIPFALEFDGEVVKAKKARFSIMKNGVQLCA